MKIQVALAILSIMAMTSYAYPRHPSSALSKWDMFGFSRHSGFGGGSFNRQDFPDFIRKVLEYLRKLKEKKNPPRGEIRLNFKKNM